MTFQPKRKISPTTRKSYSKLVVDPLKHVSTVNEIANGRLPDEQPLSENKLKLVIEASAAHCVKENVPFA